jgi:hypothetical protein
LTFVPLLDAGGFFGFSSSSSSAAALPFFGLAAAVERGVFFGFSSTSASSSSSSAGRPRLERLLPAAVDAGFLSGLDEAGAELDEDALFHASRASS